MVPGSRIRFDAPNLGYQVAGTLVSWESDTLWVKADGDAPGLMLMVPADSISRLQVRLERSRTLAGFGIGVLTGTVLALIASPNWVDEDGNCTTAACLAYELSPHLNTRLAVLGSVGALLGAIAGSETKTRTWVDVGAAPDGGLALGLTISF